MTATGWMLAKHQRRFFFFFFFFFWPSKAVYSLFGKRELKGYVYVCLYIYICVREWCVLAHWGFALQNDSRCLRTIQYLLRLTRRRDWLHGRLKPVRPTDFSARSLEAKPVSCKCVDIKIFLIMILPLSSFDARSPSLPSSCGEMFFKSSHGSF